MSDKKPKRRIITQSTFNSVIDEIITDAQADGKFDNLRNHGKPLDLSVNPYEGDNALAFKMLKDNDVIPAWIADRRDLLEEIATWREKTAAQWQKLQPQFEALITNNDHVTHQRRHLALTTQWETQITALNKKINKCNVTIPIPHLRFLKLTLPAELTRLGALQNSVPSASLR